MSCDIRIYRSKDKDKYCYSHDLLVTACVGNQMDPSIQLTIGGKFIILSSDELRDLTQTIERRLNGDEGYTATGNEREKIEYKANPRQHIQTKKYMCEVCEQYESDDIDEVYEHVKKVHRYPNEDASLAIVRKAQI